MLEIFRVVAIEQSVTRAAQRLQRVQSNVTTRIQQLEEELGASLFLRDGKCMTLTAEGQRFLEYAEKLLALAEEARQSLHPGKPGGHLRIGAMESTSASRLPGPLARYHSLWPNVHLTISTGTTRDLMDAVLARKTDCALVADPASLDADGTTAEALDPGLDATRVFSEQLMLVLPAQHGGVSSVDNPGIRTLAGFARGCTYRQIAENWFASNSTTPGEKLTVLEVNSYHAILACVAAGSCIAILPQSVLDLQRQPLDVRTHPIMTVDTLLIRRTAYSTPAFEEFRRILLQHA